ncbi:MAG: cryptochrome/photolyase family protein [Bryobacterales bacterium]|nr:cryptochrome/photolyase family protein [Bryobacterales bacterium]
MPERSLIVILGDQLDLDSAAFDHMTPDAAIVWMAEAAAESTHVWSHKARTVLFLSAMRHFAEALQDRGWNVDYRTLDDPTNTQTLGSELQRAIRQHQPDRIVMVQPGDYRVREEIQTAAVQEQCPIEIREDRHFLCPLPWFREYASGRKQLRLEFFYREMRRMHGVLMQGSEPMGGQWNFDAANREAFSKSGPPPFANPIAFAPDETTRQVMHLVEERFAGHPGSLANFDFPVTHQQAELALADFIQHRLPHFGRYQDAMWSREPYLFHSRLSAAMNLKLLSPRKVIEAAEAATQKGHASIESVEGFIRQILGWREYVRGIYWTFMPEYAAGNALEANTPLPAFYWTGETEYRCLADTIQQTLEYGFAHHIQRLMVTGLYALLLGVSPREIHEWYLAVYVDAVEWVELPNVIGMSQFADGGLMASKPYAATGKYIQRMSNYCSSCRFNPAEATGPNACPFTTLYWDFLMRNEERLRKIPRMELQLRNLVRLAPARREEIARHALALKQVQ